MSNNFYENKYIYIFIMDPNYLEIVRDNLTNYMSVREVEMPVD